MTPGTATCRGGRACSLSRLGERDHAAADARGGCARLFFPLDERAARYSRSRGGGRGCLHPSSGRGSATTAACATCTVQRSCCAKNTAANCLLITTGCLLCPASASTTAGAVASIAFGLPVPAVDSNVLRVAARLDNDFTPITDAKFKKQTRERFAALHAVRPPRRPQPIADGARCNRLSAERRAAL